MARNYKRYLADDTKAMISDQHHRYEFPRRDEHRAFTLLGQALRKLDGYAIETDIQDRESAYVGVVRRLTSLFELAYDAPDDKNPRTYNPTVDDLTSVLYDAREKPARTISVEKTSTSLILEYKHTFTYDEYDNGTDEHFRIVNDREDKTAGQILRACCRGIEDEHTPRKWTNRSPILESWRGTRPSKVSVSLRETMDGIELGLSNTPPTKPLAYYPYNFLRFGGGYPYAHTTLTLEKQDSAKAPRVNTGWL